MKQIIISVLIVIFVTTSAFSQDSLSFTRTSYAVGDAPICVSSGDLDGDGYPDLASGNWWSNPATISILINRQDGTFDTAFNLFPPRTVSDIKIADMDGDGDNDMVVVAWGLYLYRNQGNLNFDSATYLGIALGGGSCVLDDLNGDGFLDIATDYVSVYLNHGDGAFETPVNYTVGTYPQDIISCDIDNDGDIDLATANWGPTDGGNGTISILNNNGDGHYSAAVNYTAGINPCALYAIKLGNEDKKDILVLHDRDIYQLWLFSNDGTGTLTPSDKYAVGGGAWELCSADFNLDGWEDVAIAGGICASSLDIWGNIGNDTLVFVNSFWTCEGMRTQSITTDDLDLDGDFDAVLADFGTGTLTVDSIVVFINDIITKKYPIITDFEQGDDGWICSGDGSCAIVDTGNGYFFIPDPELAPVTAVIAPEKFLGDWAELNGTGSLSFDLISFGNGQTHQESKVYLWGSDGYAYAQFETITPNYDYVSYNIPISQDNWTCTNTTWEALLSDIDSFLIAVDFFTGTEYNYFDNVRLSLAEIPQPQLFVEPSSIVTMSPDMDRPPNDTFITITTLTGESINWSAMHEDNWLQLSHYSGQTDDTLIISFDMTNIVLGVDTDTSGIKIKSYNYSPDVFDTMLFYYVGDTIWIQSNQASNSPQTCAIWAGFDEPVIPFTDRFEDAIVGNWVAISNSISVSDDQAASGLYSMQFNPGSTYEIVAVRSDFSAADGKYSSKFMVANQRGDVGFRFQYQNSSNYYEVAVNPLNTDNPTYEIAAVINNSRQILASTDNPIATRFEWFSIDILRNISTGLIQAVVNGTDTLTAYDQRITERGTVAIRTWVNSSVDNLHVYADDISFGETPALPELICQDLSFQPVNPYEGQAVTIIAYLTNQGDTAVDQFQVNLIDDTTNSVIGTVTVPALAAGGQTTVSFDWTVTSCRIFSLTAVVDPDNFIIEMNEYNNSLTRQLQPICYSQLSVLVEPTEQTAGVGDTIIYDISVVNNLPSATTIDLETTGLPLGWASLEQTQIWLTPGGTRTIPLTVVTPDDCFNIGGTYYFQIEANASDAGFISNAPGILHVNTNPEITGLLPINGQIIGSNDVTIIWNTLTNASGEVFYRAANDAEFQSVNATSGIRHEVQLLDLSRNTHYEWYVATTDDCGVSQSEIRSFIVGNGVFFTNRPYVYSVERDYAQYGEVSITNEDNQPHSVRVEVINPYDDLIAGFVGNGSIDETILLSPGEVASVAFIMHAQDAKLKDYDLSFELTTEDNTEQPITDYANAHINIDWPYVDFEFQEVSFDTTSLIRTLRILNIGDPVSDLAVQVENSLGANIVIYPSVNHAHLNTGESLEFELIPIFDDTSQIKNIQPVANSAQEFSGNIMARAAGITRQYNFLQEITKPLFETHIPNVILTLREIINSWYCTNRPEIFFSFLFPPLRDLPTIARLLLTFDPQDQIWQINEHDVCVDINGHPVTPCLTNTIPDGTYPFEFDPSYLNISNRWPTINTVGLDTRHLNGGHYVITTGAVFSLCFDDYSEWICADDPEQAEQILRNRPYLRTSPTELIVAVVSPEENAWLTIGAPVDLEVNVIGDDLMPVEGAEVQVGTCDGKVITLADEGDGFYTGSWMPSFAADACLLDVRANLCGASGGQLRTVNINEQQAPRLELVALDNQSPPQPVIAIKTGEGVTLRATLLDGNGDPIVDKEIEFSYQYDNDISPSGSLGTMTTNNDGWCGTWWNSDWVAVRMPIPVTLTARFAGDNSYPALEATTQVFVDSITAWISGVVFDGPIQNDTSQEKRVQDALVQAVYTSSTGFTTSWSGSTDINGVFNIQVPLSNYRVDVFVESPIISTDSAFGHATFQQDYVDNQYKVKNVVLRIGKDPLQLIQALDRIHTSSVSFIDSTLMLAAHAVARGYIRLMTDESISQSFIDWAENSAHTLAQEPTEDLAVGIFKDYLARIHKIPLGDIIDLGPDPWSKIPKMSPGAQFAALVFQAFIGPLIDGGAIRTINDEIFPVVPRSETDPQVVGDAIFHALKNSVLLRPQKDVGLIQLFNEMENKYSNLRTDLVSAGILYSDFPLSTTISSLNSAASDLELSCPNRNATHGVEKLISIYFPAAGIISDPLLVGNTVDDINAYWGEEKTIELIGTASMTVDWTCTLLSAGIILTKAALFLGGATIPVAIAAEAVAAQIVVGCTVAETVTAVTGKLDVIHYCLAIPARIGNASLDASRVSMFLSSTCDALSSYLSEYDVGSTRISITSVNSPNIVVPAGATKGEGQMQVTIVNYDPSKKAVGKVWGIIYARLTNGQFKPITVMDHVASLNPSNSSNSQTFAFHFSVPTIETIGARNYTAYAFLVSSAGFQYRGINFSVSHSTNNALIGNSQTYSAEVNSNDKYLQQITVPPTSVKVEATMIYPGSDYNLHIYDDLEKHIGYDTLSGNIELDIPGAKYIGPHTFPELISFIPETGREYFIVVEPIEAYCTEEVTINVVSYNDIPATIFSGKDTLYMTVYPGDSSYGCLTLYEVGGQHGTSIISYQIDDLILLGSQDRIPSKSVNVTSPSMYIGADSSITSNIVISTSSNTQSGDYIGKLSILLESGTLEHVLKLHVAGIGITPTYEWINVYCPLPTIDNQPLQHGDIITAYDPDGILCGMDTVKADSSYGFMPVYRDDNFSDEDEGADPGDTISFRINGTPVITDPPVIWIENGTRIEVCQFVTERCLDIHLKQGWNLISWNVQYAPDITDFIEPIRDVVDMVIGFDRGGLIYKPDFERFSTLDSLDYYHGYWIKAKFDTVVTICGDLISPNDTLELFKGWNLVSYWPELSYTPEQALTSIDHTLVQALGYDDSLTIYKPDWTFSTLNIMKPGLGYWVRVNDNSVLDYPGFASNHTPLNQSLNVANIQTPIPSRNWISVYGAKITVDSAEITDNSSIEIRTSDGVLCGQSYYQNGILKFTSVYGYDEVSEETRLYPKEMDSVYIYVNGVKTAPPIIWQNNMNIVKVTSLYSQPGPLNLIPDKYRLYQNYPNPFNPVTEISFDLPHAGDVKLEIFNIMGQKVTTLVDKGLSAGHHKVEWDAYAQASGVYFYKITAGNYVETKKMMLLK